MPLVKSVKTKSQKNANKLPLKGPKIKPITIQNSSSIPKFKGPLKKMKVKYFKIVKTANNKPIKAISLRLILI